MTAGVTVSLALAGWLIVLQTIGVHRASSWRPPRAVRAGTVVLGLLAAVLAGPELLALMT